MATAELETVDDLFLADDEDEGGQANKHLLFNIGEELYGLNIAEVTEIIEMQRITAVPDMPGYVKGVINLRGKVIPVMDLRLRFGIEERAYDDRTCMIVVNVDDAALGLIVDTVAEVHDILGTDIEPPPEFKSDGERNRYVSGLGKIEERVAILISAGSILREKELEAIVEKQTGGSE